MNRFVLRQSLLLLLTASIWGVAFVAQSVGMDYVEPFTFSAVRNLIGAVVLLPYIALRPTLSGGRTISQETVVYNKKTLMLGGISCGILLFIAGNLQQIGIQYTTVGKAGFITAMYIVLVPVFGIFIRKKVGGRVWLAVGIAVFGLYLLCMADGSFSLQRGDFLVLCCAAAFALHILVIDYFAPKADGVKMSCIQFFVCAALSGICMLIFEEPKISSILSAWLPLLYAGVLSCGVAYTLQIVGQKGMNPTAASLILSLESVVSVVSGWMILNQKLQGKEMIGCVLMFGAIVLVQLPQKKRRLCSQ